MGERIRLKVRTTSPVLRRALARQDICPECGGELDTGYECNDCGFDARPEAEYLYQPTEAKK